MLEQYLSRVGLSSPPSTDVAGLDRLQRAHGQSIGFENLDIRLGREIRVDSDSVFDKLVRRGRGGYCFEQNRLFSDALTALGLSNRAVLARGLLNIPPEEPPPPLTHMCLTAEIEGAAWLLDAGFGGLYIAPMPIVDGTVARSGHRIRRIGGPEARGSEWLLEFSRAAQFGDLESLPDEGWQPQYSFDLSHVAQSDLEQASHWTSTRPDQRFTTTHIASISRPDGFVTMMERELSVYGPAGRELRTIDTPAEYGETLRALFRLNLSDEEAARLPLFATE